MLKLMPWCQVNGNKYIYIYRLALYIVRFIMRFAAYAKDRVVPVGGGWILAFVGCIFYKIVEQLY